MTLQEKHDKIKQLKKRIMRLWQWGEHLRDDQTLLTLIIISTRISSMYAEIKMIQQTKP